MFLSRYFVDRNNTIASMFRTHYTPDFFVAEHYCLRNTTSWISPPHMRLCIEHHTGQDI
jgi:hypothetical protein